MISPLEWLDYAEFYPHKGEKGYDGVHEGGVKGLRDDTPDEVLKQYKEQEEARKKGIIF